DKWLSLANFFITATILNLALRWMIHYVAASGVGLPRRDGTYELLLTTPLLPAEIVEGHVAALRRRFRRISLVVFGLEILTMNAGLFLHKWSTPSLLVYLVLWAGLLFWEWQQSWNLRRALLSMWAGLNSVRPANVAWRVTGFNAWIWIWLLF